MSLDYPKYCIYFYNSGLNKQQEKMITNFVVKYINLFKNKTDFDYPTATIHGDYIIIPVTSKSGLKVTDQYKIQDVLLSENFENTIEAKMGITIKRILNLTI